MTSSDLTSTLKQPPKQSRTRASAKSPVEVPAEDVTREWKSALARFQKHARIPGFRSGKVPATLIRSKFADEIKSEVVEHLMPAAFREETKKQNLIPIGQPRVVELELEEEKPLRFKAVFEVLPPFEVDGYKEIKVAHEAGRRSATKRCEKTIDALREQNSTYVNVDEDRGLADGDYGSVAFKSTSQEEGAEPVEMNDVLVDIGGSEHAAGVQREPARSQGGRDAELRRDLCRGLWRQAAGGQDAALRGRGQGHQDEVRAGAERRVGEGAGHRRR